VILRRNVGIASLEMDVTTGRHEDNAVEKVKRGSDLEMSNRELKRRMMISLLKENERVWW
jgi:hypothetical protein